MIDLERIRSHLFDRGYMSGVERDDSRVKSTGEVFTPDPAVQKMIDLLPRDFFKDPTKTAIDPACGDGQWLAEILWRKLQAGHDFETALGTIYGVDIMADNVRECRRRLMCGYPKFQFLIEGNILIGNALDPLADIEGQSARDQDRMIELFASDAQKIALLKQELELGKNQKVRIDPRAAQLFQF